MKEVGDDRNPLDQQYPKARARRVCCQPQRPQRSFRRQWGRRPSGRDVS